MSRRGKCDDSAVMESFCGNLHAAWLDRRPLAAPDETQRGLLEYLDVFYNRQRIHSARGYRASIPFEQSASP